MKAQYQIPSKANFLQGVFLMPAMKGGVHMKTLFGSNCISVC